MLALNGAVLDHGVFDGFFIPGDAFVVGIGVHAIEHIAHLHGAFGRDTGLLLAFAKDAEIDLGKGPARLHVDVAGVLGDGRVDDGPGLGLHLGLLQSLPTLMGVVHAFDDLLACHAHPQVHQAECEESAAQLKLRMRAPLHFIHEHRGGVLQGFDHREMLFKNTRQPLPLHREVLPVGHILDLADDETRTCLRIVAPVQSGFAVLG